MYIFTLPYLQANVQLKPSESRAERAEWLSSDYQPLGHYLVTLWRDDWNDTTCDTTRPRDKLARERETKRKGYIGVLASSP
jgi:hypothetical protein